MTSPEAPWDLALLLSHAERRLTSRLSALLEAEDCGLAEWRVLTLLADGEGHPMAEVADFALLPAPSLTKLVDAMVATNLVYRRGDVYDRRRVLAYLAPRGRVLYDRVAGRVSVDQAEVLHLLADVAADGDLPSQLTALTRVLAAALVPVAGAAPGRRPAERVGRTPRSQM